MNPDLSLAGVKTMEEIYTRSMARASFALVLLAAAAALASYIPSRRATVVDPVEALRAE